MAVRIQEGTKVYRIYRCKACEKAGRPNSVRRVEYEVGRHGFLIDPTDLNRYPSMDYTCPTCKRETKGFTVNAVLVPDQKCNGKCVNAIGASCSCSCGGHNHGAGYTYHFEAVK